MARKTKRWPLWKITAAAVIFALASGALFYLSSVAGNLTEEQPAGDQPQLLTVPIFVMIMGVAAAMLCLLCLVWLGVRIKEARTPPWERKKKKTRRRRR